jgi:hypothetical protein
MISRTSITLVFHVGASGGEDWRKHCWLPTPFWSARPRTKFQWTPGKQKDEGEASIQGLATLLMKFGHQSSTCTWKRMTCTSCWSSERLNPLIKAWFPGPLGWRPLNHARGMCRWQDLPLSSSFTLGGLTLQRRMGCRTGSWLSRWRSLTSLVLVHCRAD